MRKCRYGLLNASAPAVLKLIRFIKRQSFMEASSRLETQMFCKLYVWMKFRALLNWPRNYICVICTKLDKAVFGWSWACFYGLTDRVVNIKWSSLSISSLKKNAVVQDVYFLICQCVFIYRNERTGSKVIDEQEQLCTIYHATVPGRKSTAYHSSKCKTTKLLIHC